MIFFRIYTQRKRRKKSYQNVCAVWEGNKRRFSFPFVRTVADRTRTHRFVELARE